MKKILIVIPAHNEKETIYEVVTRSLQHGDVSVTDDGSRDETPSILTKIRQECKKGRHRHSLNVITHESATHIPRGIQDGLRWGVLRNYDFIITMDAGMSHNPDELPKFIGHDESVDLLIGSRKKTQNVPFYRKLISRLGAMAVNYALSPTCWNLHGPGIKDCTSGYRRYSRKAAELVARSELRSKSFDFHMEALALCVRSGMKVDETPITYVFSSSSFTMKVLSQAIRFGLHLLAMKRIKA
jgi:dolichol-phosphate mannosyltransferase